MHVVLARLEPLLVVIDPEFVVKHVIEASEGSTNDKNTFIINGGRQKLDYYGWSELKRRLCHQEIASTGGQLEECIPRILAEADKEIRWAVVTGFSSTVHPLRVVGTPPPDDPTLKSFDRAYGGPFNRKTGPKWATFGLDVSLVHKEGKIHAKLLDWNYNPALCLQPVLCSSVTMSMMRQVYQLVSDTAFEERRNVPDHPNVDYDLKNLDKPRLETVINASAGEAYCRDHYLSSTGAALPRPGTSTVGGGKEATGVLVGTP